MLGAGFRDGCQYRWIMLLCKDAYETVIYDPKVTFRQGYLVVKTICQRFNMKVKRFWAVFKNFTGDGPFTYKGKPWMFGILFNIASHEYKHWLRPNILQVLKKDPSFSFDSCSYKNALKLLIFSDSDLRHYRTLDWCHGISGVLKNIQLAKGIRFAGCANIKVFFSDIQSVLSGFNEQTNTG